MTFQSTDFESVASAIPPLRRPLILACGIVRGMDEGQ